MISTTNARLAGVLSNIAAAGLTARRVEFETPDDGPITLTMIGTAQPRWRGSQRCRRAERVEIEKDDNDAP